MHDHDPSANPLERTLIITRIFNASREQLFDMWSDPKHVAQWWGPRHFTNPVCQIDLRPGGAMVIHMRAPDGTIYPMKGVFGDIVRPERLVFTSAAFEQPDGSSLLEQVNTLTFVELGQSKTKLTLHVHVTRSDQKIAQALEGMEAGWSQSLDKLEALFPASPEQPACENRPTLSNGKICYLEIPAADAQRSAAFYLDVFGWKSRRRGDGHLAFDDAVGEVSGSWVTGRKPDIDPGLLIYIMIDDMQTALAAVIRHGGKIVQPVGADHPEITARFADPFGNIFGLYQEPSRTKA